MRNPTLIERADSNHIQHGVIDDNAPLEQVEVRVSGRTSSGWFNSWGSDYTDSDGSFTVTESQCDARVVKVEARFHNGDLDVSGPDSPKWYVIYETPNAIDPSLIDLQREPFRGDDGDQATDQAHTDAQTWVVYQRAIDYVDDTGHRFYDQVVVHNPATLTQGTSATDPPTGDIHIDPNQTTRVDVMLHELGHAWSYPVVDNEGCLTWDLVNDHLDHDPTTNYTHDDWEKPCVAFEEGFAQFFDRKLEYELHNAGELNTAPQAADVTPWTREHMRDHFGLRTLDDTSHSDFGWEQAFRVLTASDLPLLLFGDGKAAATSAGIYAGGLGCTGQPLLKNRLADALRIVGDSGDRFDLHSQPDLVFLLLRAQDRGYLPTQTDFHAYEQSIDPAATTFEPHTEYGC